MDEPCRVRRESWPWTMISSITSDLSDNTLVSSVIPSSDAGITNRAMERLTTPRFASSESQRVQVQNMDQPVRPYMFKAWIPPLRVRRPTGRVMHLPAHLVDRAVPPPYREVRVRNSFVSSVFSLRQGY